MRGNVLREEAAQQAARQVDSEPAELPHGPCQPLAEGAAQQAARQVEPAEPAEPPPGWCPHLKAVKKRGIGSTQNQRPEDFGIWQ